MMITALRKLKLHCQLYHYSININRSRLSIMNHSETLKAINRKIKLFNRRCALPSPKEAPSDLANFLVFHRASALPIFQWIQREVRNLSFAGMPKELRALTDCPEKFDLIMDIAFDFGWREMQCPFIGDQTRLPTFDSVRAGILEVLCLDNKFRRLRFGQLVRSGCPYDATVGILSELSFMVRPGSMDPALDFVRIWFSRSLCLSRIFASFTHTGIGIAESGEDGWYVSQIFVTFRSVYSKKDLILLVLRAANLCRKKESMADFVLSLAASGHLANHFKSHGSPPAESLFARTMFLNCSHCTLFTKTVRATLKVLRFVPVGHRLHSRHLQ
jgi:hypothetical protein